MKKEEIFKELTKLPALLRERVPYQAFDIKYMFSRNGEIYGGEAKKTLAENHECGTVACVLGWSEVFEYMGLLDFNPITGLNYNECEFITYSGWGAHPTEHTLEAACARIEYVVKHGHAPDGWEEQMLAYAPVTYREIN